MTKTKSTKRALLMSALALLMCVSMLIGSTFAWFTDSVTSGSNVIQSGKLDIVLEYWNGNKWADAEGKVLEFERAYNSYEGQEILWEPGCTFNMPKIRVRNEGNLAAKVVILVNGISGDDKLLEALTFTTTVDADTANRAVEAWLNENGNVLAPIQADIGTVLWDEGLAPKGVVANNGVTDTTAEITLSAHMDENAGNEYQGLTVEGISITALATQTTYESDSFNDQYDANATYPEIWDGAIGTVPDEVDNTITISTPAELAAFAAAVNNGNSYSGKTVVLANDINLGNQTWTPIGDCESGEYFQGTFDGQGNTIYNLYVDKSTDESQFSTAGLFGWVDAAGATVKNLNVDGATVLGSHWVGVIAGYWTDTIENCSVNNATVVAYNVNDDANGDKVGGIVGYLNDDSDINNNTVTNSTITGNRDIGGIVGAVAVTIDSMSNNKVSDTVITYATEKDYGSAGAIVSGRTGYTPDETNVATNVTIIKSLTVSTAGDLATALEKGENVVLSGDIEAVAETTTPYDNKVGFIQNGGVLDGNGNTLSVECYGDDYGIMTSGGTIKNLTIDEGCRAIMIMSPTGDIIVDNVNIGGDGVLYCINTGEAGPDGVKLSVTNSTLAGWTSYGPVVESASFTNVKFEQGEYKDYASIYGRVLKPYVNTTITDCSFIKHMNLDLSSLTEGHKVTFENCTVNGQVVTADVFTPYSGDDSVYDTALFSVDLPGWADSIDDCIVFN